MNEERVALLVVCALGLVGCWRAIRWFVTGPPAPNPWDQETEDRIQQPESVAICTRCLEPLEAASSFCPHCGLPVDALVPFSPYLYAFALGDALVTGTSRRFPVKWFTVIGFLLLSIAVYSFFFPIYWYGFWRNLRRMRVPDGPDADGALPRVVDDAG